MNLLLTDTIVRVWKTNPSGTLDSVAGKGFLVPRGEAPTCAYVAAVAAIGQCRVPAAAVRNRW